MMDTFIGARLQLDCGELAGSFSGIVLDITAEKITLKEALHNNVPCNSETITLHKSSLRDIVMLEPPDPKKAAMDARKEKIKQIPNTTAAYICPTNPPQLPIKKKATGDVKKQLNFEEDKSAFSQCRLRSKSSSQPTGSTNIPGTDILHDLFNFRSDGRPIANASPRRDHSKSFSHASNGNGRYQQHRGGKSNYSNTSAFHVQAESLQADFDFEGNLALFDKKAFYQEVDSGRLDAPDVVKTSEPKLRCDENVLGTSQKPSRAIEVPCRAEVEYTTDDGVSVPGITEELRVAALSAAEKSGFSGLRVAEVFGRNAADFLIQQMGGAQRLRPENRHQLPQVAFVIGTGRRALMGLSMARHLANRDLGVHVCLSSPCSAELNPELELFRTTGAAVVFSLRELPFLLDFIVLATSEILTPDDPIAEWSRRNRAPTATVCPTGRNPGELTCKLNLQYVLPVPVDASYGQVCLCEAGFTKLMFKQVGIAYSSPFGHRSAVQLRTQ